MPKSEKVERVAELRERIEVSDALLLAEYRGLTVSDIRDLRRALAEGGARFSVVKNTLMRRAAGEAAMAELESLLVGPTAVAFITGDPVAAAKKLADAQRRFPALVLKGGWMEGRPLSADEAKALADLDSREVMLSTVAGMLKSEMARAAATLAAVQSRFVALLEAYRQKLPPEDGAGASEPVPVTGGGPDEGAARSGEPSGEAEMVTEPAARDQKEE